MQIRLNVCEGIAYVSVMKVWQSFIPFIYRDDGNGVAHSTGASAIEMSVSREHESFIEIQLNMYPEILTK